MIIGLPLKDYLLVGAQGALFLAYLLHITIIEIKFPLILHNMSLVVFLLGILILVIAMLQLNTNLSPFPTPKSNGELILSGLYKFIRHPIYTGLLFTSIGYAVYDNSIYRILISLLLFLLFLIKSSYEERKLLAQFGAYKDYMKTTGKFFPKIF